MRLFTIAIFLYSSSAFAAGTYLEAFDFKNCLHWRLSTDVGGDTQAYKNAKLLADRQPDSYLNREVKEWTTYETGRAPFVYSAIAFTENEKHIEKFGVCYHQTAIKKSRFRCLPNQDFPLSGATYEAIKSKGQLLTLQCIEGCNAVPVYIHDEGYENMEGETNLEANNLKLKFSNICKRQ